MVDVFLLVVAIVVPFLLLAGNTYLMAHYMHPGDKEEAMWLKVLVVLGFTFAECAVLLLPMDVANRAGIVGCGEWNSWCGELRMDIVWQMVYLTIAVWVFVLIPLGVFYYESDDGLGNQNNSRLWSAIKWESVLLVVVVTVLVLMYAFLSESYVPTQVISQPATQAFIDFGNSTPPLDLSAAEVPCLGTGGACSAVDVDLTISVTFPIYVVGFMSFLGWFLFVIYGGIGVVALPMDLISSYIHRPRYMPADEFAELKKDVIRRGEELRGVGESLRKEMRELREAKKAGRGSRKERRDRTAAVRKTLNQFKAAVFVLDRDWEDLRLCHNEFQSHNPLIPIFKLIVGLGCVVVSLLWLLQIGLYVVPQAITGNPVSPFLNDYFIWFDAWFPLFGTLSVGAFAVFLLAAVIKGNFKFGMRFFLVSIHPIRYGHTMLNSFLVNLVLILLSCGPVVQFCTQAFATYARLTDADVIFSTQIRYLQFFRYAYAYNVFIYALPAWAILAIIHGFCRPQKSDVSVSDMRERLRTSAKRNVELASRS